MKKRMSFLIALGAIYANLSYASPALICPATITCSNSTKLDAPVCQNMPAEWEIGINSTGKIVNDRDYVLHFTGAVIDSDEFANCVYNLIGASEPSFSVAVRTWDVQPKKDPTLAWKKIRIGYGQRFTAGCFIDLNTYYSKIAHDPEMCLFEPLVYIEPPILID